MKNRSGDMQQDGIREGYSTVEYVSFVVTGVYGTIRAVGKYSDRCDDPGKDRGMVFGFYPYTCLYH